MYCKQPGRSWLYVPCCELSWKFLEIQLTVPHLKITNEVEYIPICAGQFRAYIHNPTCYDTEMFVFDTIDHHPCPLLHFQASPICLMIQAQPHLASAIRLQSEKADVADTQITTLIKLYQRQPAGVGNDPITVPVPASYASIAGMMGQPNTHPSACVFTMIPSSLPLSHSSASPPLMSYCFSL